MNTDRWRLFFALPLAERTRQDLVDVQRWLQTLQGERPPKARWLAPELLHITAKFLGDVPADRIPELVGILQQEAALVPCVRIHGERLASFGPTSAPRVVVMTCTPDDNLQHLAARLNRRCTSLGIAKETQSFRAHVTLARLKGKGNPRSWLPHAPQSLIVAGLTELVLFRSQLSSAGPSYTVVASASLAAP